MAVDELNREDLQKIWDEEAAGDAPPVESPPEAPAKASGEQETNELPAEAPEPEKQPDPLEEIRAKLGVLDRLEQRVRNTEGHIGGLTSELRTFQKELKTAATAAVDAQGAAPSQQQIAAAAKSLDKWTSLKSDFPEWADAIEERIGAMPTPQSQSVDIDALRAKITAEVAAAFEPRLVDVAHRGWRQLVRTDSFKDWLNAQPDEVRNLAGSPKADDAIDLLDRYKGANRVLSKTAEEIEAERRARLKSAAEAPRGQGSMPARKGTDAMTDEEYWNYLARNGGRK